ncbi:MAG: zinc-ribbon domain-containing protein, partial [Clostridia bacterium]|nr:zinc-ribbon domain-containing protein [Clostridia bacterium]
RDYMSFFSHLRHMGWNNPHMGRDYYQQSYPNNQMAPQQTVMCPSCQTIIAMGSKFCPACGEKIALSPVGKCSQCGTTVPGGAKFCPGCGKHV